MGGTMSTKNVVFIPNINLKNGRSTKNNDKGFYNR